MKLNQKIKLRILTLEVFGQKSDHVGGCAFDLLPIEVNIILLSSSRTTHFSARSLGHEHKHRGHIP